MYNEGKAIQRGISPSHLSFQNLTELPIPRRRRRPSQKAVAKLKASRHKKDIFLARRSCRSKACGDDSNYKW